MVGKRSRSANPIRNTAKMSRTTRKSKSTEMVEPNLSTVSRQTASGIMGATIGGMIAGPVGAIAGGVAGALVGNVAAEGHHPIGAAATQFVSVAKTPLRIVAKRVKSAVSSAIGTTRSGARRRLATAKKSPTSSGSQFRESVTSKVSNQKKASKVKTRS